MNPDMTNVTWLTSRACNNSACVQVAHLPGGMVALRDSKDTSKPAHVFDSGGPAASISPKPGLTGESEVAASRTALLIVQQGIEAVGRKLRSQDNSLETGGRPGGAKGSGEMPVPVGTDEWRHSQALIRRRQKR